MDIFSLLINLLLLTLLGLLVAFNPTLIVVDLLLVLRSSRPIFNTAILAAGLISSMALLFAIASLFIDPDSQISLRQLNLGIEIPPLIDILAGSLLLAYALNRSRRTRMSKSTKKGIDIRIPEKPRQLFMFAFIKASISVSNIFAILILAKLAATNNWNPALGAVAVIWLIVVGVIPLAIVAYYHEFKHQSLMTINQRLNAVLSKDIQSILTYALATIGVIFIVSGAIGLIKA